MSELILSDGTRSIDFLSEPRGNIYVQQEGINLPVVSRENTYAEGSDSEGRTRIRSRALNSEAGSFSVFFEGADADEFWDAVDDLQELVESAHRNKGTITYTPPGGVAVTFDLEGIDLTDLPQRGVTLRAFHGEATVSFECKPYGRLAEVSLFSPRINLVPNPSFEVNTTGWTLSATGWTGASMTRTAISPFTGSDRGFANYVVGTKDATGTERNLDCASAELAVEPNVSYTLRANGLLVSDAGALGSRVYIEWRTAASAYISFSVGTAVTGTGAKNPSVVGTSPANAAFAVVYLRTFSNVSGDTVAAFWDAIQFEKSSTLGAYFDGESDGANWQGTADASVSGIGLFPGPISDLPVELVPGQVAAWGDLTLDDFDSRARNHVEVGVQHDFDPDNPEPLLLEAVTELTALGGSSNTRSGSYATNIIRAALTTSPVAVCTSGEQPHEGLWKIRARVYPSATTIRVRLAWRAGDGPFAAERWVSVPNSAGWYDLDLGTVNVKELPSGHTSEFRVEAFATSGVPTVDVDFITLMPADNYTRLRGSSTPDPTGAVVAAEDFSTQTSGALAGKTPLLAPAGNWSGAGDAGDFTVDATNDYLYRDVISDADVNTGRYARCGSGVLAATVITADIFVDATTFGETGGTHRFGVFLRYTDTNNWLMAVYGLSTGTGLSLIKRVAGTVTTLGSNPVAPSSTWRSLVVAADTAGNVVVYDGPRGGALDPRLLLLADANLATAGALDDGGYGFYDALTGTPTTPRLYDNFTASAFPSDATIVSPAINAGRGLSVFHNTALSDNDDGSAIGTTPIREGKYLTLPPATRNSDKSRIVVRARRDDVDSGFADSGLTDSLTASLSVTPRVHLTGN